MNREAPRDAISRRLPRARPAVPAGMDHDATRPGDYQQCRAWTSWWAEDLEARVVNLPSSMSLELDRT